jgi:hypothetical protein
MRSVTAYLTLWAIAEVEVANRRAKYKGTATLILDIIKDYVRKIFSLDHRLPCSSSTFSPSSAAPRVG